jgi:NAD(P)H-flavin reductase
MIPPRRGKARLAEKVVLNDKYSQYYFEMVEPTELLFEAGQYVSIQVSPRGDRRPYSISSTPDKKHAFELLVDVTPGGLGTTFLQTVQYGQEVDILAPMGVFTLADDSTEQAVVFIATGSGIAPFRSMILNQLQAKRDPREIYLYFGLRHEQQLFWQDEFLELAESFPNFHFHPVISQPTPEWPLCRGRVTDCLAVHQQPANAGYYLCGNTKMVEQVVQMLGERGVPNEHIHHEKFY